jgi:hypothetical protein
MLMNVIGDEKSKKTREPKAANDFLNDDII